MLLHCADQVGYDAGTWHKMKFKDPAEVVCPNCSAHSVQRVADLLALGAKCPSCQNTLSERGTKMRRALDAWETYVASIWLTGCLEDRLGVRFTGDEVEAAKTLRGLVTLVETRLARNDHDDIQAAELVEWAMKQLRDDQFWQQRGPHIRGRRKFAASLDLDAPLIDAIDPHRWE